MWNWDEVGHTDRMIRAMPAPSSYGQDRSLRLPLTEPLRTTPSTGDGTCYSCACYGLAIVATKSRCSFRIRCTSAVASIVSLTKWLWRTMTSDSAPSRWALS